MKLLVATGGSGGHILPALAVVAEVQKIDPEGEVLFVGSTKPLDRELVKKAGVQFVSIQSGKLRRYFSWENVLDFFRFFAGVYDSYRIIKRFQPDAIFAKGGFVALPVAIAGRIFGIPIVAHESDTVPGIANRLIAPFAQVVCTSFPVESIAGISHEKGEKWLYTGNPTRSEATTGDAKRGREFLAFDNAKPILLVMGGSQGAVDLNRQIEKTLPEILPEMNVVILAGQGNTISEQPGVRIFPFLGEEYPDVLAAAEFVLSRSGANSLFEIAANRKPNLLIPLASSAGDHQQKNAEAFEKLGAGKIISSYFSAADILAFFHDKNGQERQKSALEKIGEQNGAKRIAEVVFSAKRG